jgi:hypothetical protein
LGIIKGVSWVRIEDLSRWGDGNEGEKGGKRRKKRKKKTARWLI